MAVIYAIFVTIGCVGGGCILYDKVISNDIIITTLITTNTMNEIDILSLGIEVITLLLNFLCQTCISLLRIDFWRFAIIGVRMIQLCLIGKCMWYNYSAGTVSDICNADDKGNGTQGTDFGSNNLRSESTIVVIDNNEFQVTAACLRIRNHSNSINVLHHEKWCSIAKLVMGLIINY